MDDKKLRALLTAVQCGSFGKATAQLGYTQSAMTHLVNKLEAELGCTLLSRSSHGVRLSEEGEHLLPYIQDYLRASDALRQEAALQEERVQLALVEESCGKGFYWTPLTDAPLVAVVPPDFPWQEDTIPLERLLQETFLSCPEQYVARLLPPGSPLLEVTASDDAAILSMVAAGLGVSVLSSFSLAGYEGQVQVLPLSEPLFRRLGAAVKTPPPANSAARHFLAFLKRQYPDKPTDNP